MKQEEQEPTLRRPLSEEEWRAYQQNREATRGHVIPFIFWIACIFLVGQFALDEDSLVRAWVYAVQTVVGLGLFIYFRPWRWYRPLNPAHIPLALVVGLAVFVLWVLPETEWIGAWSPAFREAYLTWFIFPPWTMAEPPAVSPYAPAVCGWGLTMVRLIGSAFVIATIEEFFWRGWLYRWLLGRDFLRVDLGQWHTGMFWAVSAVFALEHAQWLVGLLAGVAYLWLMIRTRDIWAAVLAHVLTNLLLGLYVLLYGRYEFW